MNTQEFAAVFFILVLVGILTGDIIIIALSISIAANLYFLTVQEPQKKKPEEPLPTIDTTIVPASAHKDYDHAYENHAAYGLGYMTAYDKVEPKMLASAGERNYTVDAALAMRAQARARDRKAIDGHITKDANYYKYHFGGEIDEAEDRPWWGRDEY